MPIIIDKNLSLVPLAVKDADEIHSLITQHKSWLAQQLYWVNGIHCFEDTKTYLSERVFSKLPKNHWFSIRHNGVIVGVFALKSVNKQGVAELGYWLAESAIGQRIINRVIDGLKITLFKQLAVSELLFHCAQNNIASQKVAIQAGATTQSLTDKVMELNGNKLQLFSFRGKLS